jgi:predicted amidohydrolase
MKILLYQQDIIWADPEANYRKVEAVLAAHPEGQLLVLPEMFTTGFVTDPDHMQLLSDAREGHRLQTAEDVEARLRQIAARHDCALAGSVAVEDTEGFHNRFYFVCPDGTIYAADKRHLFSYGGETRCYRPGRERVVAEYGGLRFLMIVCYDLRFPVWSRCVDDYDVLLCVANWPAVRQHSWNTLLQARAMENQCYVVGVNRVGEDHICPYNGGTMAVHPYGDPLTECPRKVESVISFEPDMEMLRGYRAKFPSLHDRDRFEIQI